MTVRIPLKKNKELVIKQEHILPLIVVHVVNKDFCPTDHTSELVFHICGLGSNDYCADITGEWRGKRKRIHLNGKSIKGHIIKRLKEKGYL